MAALALLVCFVAGIAVNLSLGRRPDCHCFGQLHSVPVGWGTLIRNAILAGVAGLVLWQGDQAGFTAYSLGIAPSSSLVFAGMVGLAVVIGQSWFVIYLLRQHGRILLRIDAIEGRIGTGAVPTLPRGRGQVTVAAGLPVGVTAPSFSLQGHNGSLVTLDSLRAAGKPVMLIFSAYDCEACVALMPQVRDWERQHGGAVTIAVLDRAGAGEHAKLAASRVLLQKDREVAQLYEVTGTPSAVIVRTNGTIGSPLAPGSDAIRTLLARTVGLAVRPTILPPSQARATPQAVRVGTAAPALTLPDLAGSPIELGPSRGKKTLILFWSPNCTFCKTMLGELRAWETGRRAGGPELLVVSTGSLEANSNMGLSSPVLLDDTFAAGTAFGATGTPSAVLIAEDRTILSPVVLGAPAVFALANSTSAQPIPEPSNY